MLKSAESIGNLIHYYRIVNDISQAELAKKLDVTVSAISSWERGVSRPGIQVSYILSKELNMTLDEFLLDVKTSKLKDTYTVLDDIYFKSAIVRVLKFKEENKQLFITFVIKGYQISQDLIKNVFIVSLNTTNRKILPEDMHIKKTMIEHEAHQVLDLPDHSDLSRYEITLKFKDSCVEKCLFDLQFADEFTTLEVQNNVIDFITHGPSKTIKTAEDLINFFNSDTFATGLKFLAKNHQIDVILKDIKDSIKQLTEIKEI